MKNYLSTLTTASSLRVLLGETINYSFPLKFPKSDDPKQLKIKRPVALSAIIKETDFLNKASFDERFDKKHPIELAINQLYAKGLTRAILYKIYHNKASVKAGKIKGPYSFLANFINEQHREEIENNLKQITCDKHGNLLRNGQRF